MITSFRANFAKDIVDQISDYKSQLEKFKTIKHALPAIVLHNFLNIISRDFHLTIKDIESWEIGKEYDIVTFDRNLYDVVGDIKGRHDPQIFFKGVHHRMIYCGNMKMKMLWNFTDFKDEGARDVELDTKSLDYGWGWMPLTDGVMIIDETLIAADYNIRQLDDDEIFQRKWTEFDVNSRIGWRGPMMLWDNLKYFPKIYNREEEDDD